MNNRGGFFGAIPPITKNLLIINFLVWLATIILGQQGIINLERYLGLHYWRATDFNATQLVTYMFMHSTNGITHIFFNMFSLWMFGRILEYVLTPKRFLFYYLACGLGAALVQELTWEFTWQNTFVPLLANSNGLTFDQARQVVASGQATEVINQFFNMLVTVGASGAVFGVLLAYGMIFPNMQLYIIPFPFPIKAKWVVLGYGVIELLFGVSNIFDNVAHFAHLGGMFFGFFIIQYWKRHGVIGGNGNGFY